MPELEAPVGDDVERGGHIGQHRGVAVVDAGDQGAQPQPLGGLRQCGQRRPALQAGPAAVAEDRVEVVERPPGLEDVDVVGRLPDGEHVAQVVSCGEVLNANRMEPTVVRPRETAQLNSSER